MSIKKFKKNMLQSRLYRFRKVDRYPIEKQANFLCYLICKIKRGQGVTSDFAEWLRVMNSVTKD
jgi:hypothetical protein